MWILHVEVTRQWQAGCPVPHFRALTSVFVAVGELQDSDGSVRDSWTCCLCIACYSRPTGSRDSSVQKANMRSAMLSWSTDVLGANAVRSSNAGRAHERLYLGRGIHINRIKPF